MQRGRKANGISRQTRDQKEPEWEDIGKHYTEYPYFGGHMLCDYGPFYAVTCQQHFIGQSSANGPAVG